MSNHSIFRAIASTAGFLLLIAMRASAAPPLKGDFGTIATFDKTGTITLQPWGQAPTNAKTVRTDAQTILTVGNAPAKVADLKDGMWIKLDDVSEDGVARTLSAGHFVSQDGNKVVIFKGLSKEFLITDVKDWYTNEAAGIKFKINLMRDKERGVTGINLRPANYREPDGGFVFYWPTELKGTVFGVHGAKPGTTIPDADGKIVITKDSVDESYWKHPKNPNKLEAGFVSGLTELTVRKIPRQKQ